MSLRYAKLLVFWGVVFVISLFLIFTGFGNIFQSSSEPSIGPDKPAIGPEGEDTWPNWNLILGVITAVTSGAGFITTTFFAMRDDRRETALHDLQIKNLQKEIEQKDLEIKNLRQDQESYDSS